MPVKSSLLWGGDHFLHCGIPLLIDNLLSIFPFKHDESGKEKGEGSQVRAEEGVRREKGPLRETPRGPGDFVGGTGFPRSG